MLTAITIFNLIISLGVLSFFIYKYNPFWISVYRTFWMKKPISITLMYRLTKNEYGSSSKGLFTIQFRNYDKWTKWDDEQYRTGKYKKVSSKQKQIA